MKILTTAHYLGVNVGSYSVNDLWLSITQYTSQNLPNHAVHAHLNPHLTLLLRGGTREKRRNSEHIRRAGEVVFFSAGEPHKNSHTPIGSKNINLEFTRGFLTRYNLDEVAFEIPVSRQSPTSFTLLRAYHEVLVNDAFSSDSITQMVLDLVADKGHASGAYPSWVNCMEELMRDRWREQVTLQELAQATNKHPVTISKQFSRYFGCTLGEYMRRLKLERALDMIRHTNQSLTQIGYECGFADQTHFSRICRQLTGFSPRAYKNL